MVLFEVYLDKYLKLFMISKNDEQQILLLSIIILK